MAAPEYVPRPKDDHTRTYESPPWRSDAWFADRPGDLEGAQPHAPRMGYPGPDQGYALKLVRQFAGKLVLTPGEHEEDAIAGCVEVANKRASIFGRAPVIHDLTLAFMLWGFLTEADPELVRLRSKYFQAVANPSHYSERRRIADVVPVASLKMTASEFAKVIEADPKREKFFKRRAPTTPTTPTPAAPAS
jgi:hypothetical protein